MKVPTELLPCPFCGGYPVASDRTIWCPNRDCWGPNVENYANMDDAIAAWNRRVPSSELLELREAVKPADDPESILYSLQIASIGAPYSDVQGNLYCHPPYSPDGFRDAEFRDYGLARAVRIICNNAKALARSLQSHTGEA